MNKPPILKDGNIILRPIAEKDIKNRMLYDISSEYIKMIGISLNMLGPVSYEYCRNWYEKNRNYPCVWAIDYKGVFVGKAGLRPYEEDNKAKFSIEIYCEDYKGKGIGKIVTNMVIKYAFEVMDYHKIFLRVLDYNERAISLYKKCGFIEEGIDREGALINGVYSSDIYMSILKWEYDINK